MLNLYNSLTRKIETFYPADDMRVKMYTCGPSTYQRAHIGNYRTFLFEDVLQRYLEYLGFDVKRLITLTDVEDKAITEAKKENLTIEELTSKNEDIFFQDFQELKIKIPDFHIRASTAVDQASSLITQLTKKGYSYWYTYEGAKNAYFDPSKFSGFGKLAHLNMKTWPKKTRRFHKDTYPGTPWNKGDFIIWHGCKQDSVCYQSQIGTGRPAWNIQDPAIVTKHLGFAIDIACGGIDNLVRHHDYTIAIAEAFSGKQFSRYWLHGGHLFVDNKKMSKSKGNVYYPSDILKKGYTAEQLRFFLIYGPYRDKLNFTFEKLNETSQKLDSLKRMIKEMQQTKSMTSKREIHSFIDRIIPDFENNMNNDLAVKAAFDSLYETINKLHNMQEPLTSDNKEKLLNSIHRINSVLQCIL